MPTTRWDRLQRSAAALAVAAGAGVLGTAAGGIAAVDADLRAAAPAPPAVSGARLVVDRPQEGWDCPDDEHVRPATLREL